MTRQHPPCSACASFIPAKAGTDASHCTGNDRPAAPDDHPCPLFLERGSRAARTAARSSAEVLAELQRRHTETISRASARKP